VPTLIKLAALLAFQGQVAEAEATLRRALEVEPRAFGPNRQLGELCLKNREFDRAIGYFQTALEAQPDSGVVHLQVAVALASTNRFGPALDHARRASELGEAVKPEFLSRLESLAARGPG
jgi:tetratricopeptide (TPR) repeat protein